MMKKIAIILLLIMLGHDNSVASNIAMQVQLPFRDGASYECTQNSDDYPSHDGSTTRYALDFGMNEGTLIVAAANGKVAYRGSRYCYGNIIKIDHKNGYYTLYAHLRDNGFIVNVNDEVVAGQPIAFSGNTTAGGGSSCSTSAHLHFGLHKGNANDNSVGESVRMEVKAREYKKNSDGQLEYIKEDYFATGLLSERECYCMYDNGKRNRGNFYESIPMDSIFSPFQCHTLDQ